MKKTIAAGSASVLGLMGATLGVAGAAQAVGPATGPACLDDTEHAISATPLTNWYMACIPQYSLSRVGFTITSTTDFPAGFAHLDDPSVTSTSTLTPAANAYVGLTGGPDGLGDLSFNSETTTSQSYNGYLLNAISGVSEIDPATLPADCTATGTFDFAYQIDYLPTTVTFTQTVNGEDWVYKVVGDAGPTYLGLNFDPVTPTQFDGARSLCSVSNVGSYAGADSGSTDWQVVSSIATTSSDISLSPYFGAGKTLPDIARTPPTVVPPVVVPDPGPQLAATGTTDLGPGLGLAGAFLALGVAAGWLDRRRARVQR